MSYPDDEFENEESNESEFYIYPGPTNADFILDSIYQEYACSDLALQNLWEHDWNE